MFKLKEHAALKMLRLIIATGNSYFELVTNLSPHQDSLSLHHHFVLGFGVQVALIDVDHRAIFLDKIFSGK